MSRQTNQFLASKRIDFFVNLTELVGMNEGSEKMISYIYDVSWTEFEEKMVTALI